MDKNKLIKPINRAEATKRLFYDFDENQVKKIMKIINKHAKHIWNQAIVKRDQDLKVKSSQINACVNKCTCWSIEDTPKAKFEDALS
jgi:predicted CoA-binding protein